jgi:DUF4097 and DUF4098 domain-containing protein YvlB
VHQAFPVRGTDELRLANLAGRIELVRGQGNQLVVDATIHAQGSSANQTQQLLQGMKWVKGEDRHGREEWTLSYPVDKFDGFAYPRPGNKESEDSWFLSWLESKGHTSTTYRGEKVRIYNERTSSAPILYADLKIALPVNSNVRVRNVVGSVRGGQLEGTLTIDTGSGRVEIASFDGNLNVDTGSGDVVMGSARGETVIDTGSGDVTVHRLVGNGKVDTGSGDVVVEKVSAGRLSLDTGSGDVTVQGSLARARRVTAETGSGDIQIKGGPNAQFDIASDQGSGELLVGYSDAVLRKDGRKVVGAKRGDGHTVIRVETGSGDCTIGPKQPQP